MEIETKVLQTIAIHALYALLGGKNKPSIRVFHEPDIGDNIFIFMLGGPESDDLGDAEEIHLGLIVEVTSDQDGRFDCRVVQSDILNDPSEKTLSHELYREKWRRKFKMRKPPDDTLDE